MGCKVHVSDLVLIPLRHCRYPANYVGNAGNFFVTGIMLASDANNATDV